MKMLRWFRSLFAWHAVKSDGAWVYCENTVTGQHSAHWKGGCYGPINHNWIRDGDIIHGPRGRYVKGSENELWM
jgi:hypothetical protein